MYNISKKFLNDLFKDTSRAIVGRLCKRVEIVYKNTSLNEIQRERILKDLIREVIYENFRDTASKVKCYDYGLTFEKREIYNPTKEQ